MLFAFADAVVPTLPAAEPLAVPAEVPEAVADLVMSVLKAEPVAAVTVLLAPMPFTVTSFELASEVADLANEPEIVPESERLELMFS